MSNDPWNTSSPTSGGTNMTGSARLATDAILDTVLPTGDPTYQNWLRWVTNDDDFKRDIAAYGDTALKLGWWAWSNQVEDPDVILRERIRLGLLPTGSPTGGGGSSGPSKAQQYAAAEAAIKNQAYTLGYTTITDPQIKQLARTAVDGNWSGEQLNEQLVNDATKHWDKLTGGTILANVDQIKAGAAGQLIAVSETTARQWAKRMASGELDADGLRDMLQTQAAARYGWAAEVIGKGITMSDFLAPSRDRIARELEMNPEKLNMLDPKIMDMMTVVDPKNGQRRVANDTELARNARRDERWKSTGNARTMLSSAAMMIRRYVEGN